MSGHGADYDACRCYTQQEHERLGHAAENAALPHPRVIDAATDEDITERHNIECKNATTLRHACKAMGLPWSGTKRRMAFLLTEAGLTADEVGERFGWRARTRVIPPPEGREAGR